MIADDSEIAEIFNQYFINIVPDLRLKLPDTLTHHSPKVNNPILNAVFKYPNQPSIKTTLKNCIFFQDYDTRSCRK